MVDIAICDKCGKDKENVHTICMGVKNGKVITSELCEECNWEDIRKEQAKYKKEYDEKVLPYFKENKYIVKIDKYSKKQGRKVSLFRFKRNPNESVDFIRKEMEKTKMTEDWIDVHDENINGMYIEFVNYLSFSEYEYEDEFDREGKEIDGVSYYFSLIKESI